MSKTDDLVSLLPLPPLEFRILVSLRDGPLHGYRIMKDLEERGGTRRGYPANLYRRVRALRNKGLLREVEAPVEPTDHRQRKFFQLTDLGRTAVMAEVERMRELLAEAEQFAW